MKGPSFEFRDQSRLVLCLDVPRLPAYAVWAYLPHPAWIAFVKQPSIVHDSPKLEVTPVKYFAAGVMPECENGGVRSYEA